MQKSLYLRLPHLMRPPQHSTIYLLTGSNMGAREQYLCAAIHGLEERGYTLLAQSAVYETAAWGNVAQQAFLNQALVVFKIGCTPTALLQDILAIEKASNRHRTKTWAPRTLDIDILLFGDEIMETPSLKIPHPYLPQRRFALLPLAELAPQLVHPVLQKSIDSLLEECPDKLAVKSITASPCPKRL